MDLTGRQVHSKNSIVIEGVIVCSTTVIFWKCVHVHLNAIFGSFLQVRYDRVVPQVNEPLPELRHWHWAWQEKAGTWRRQGFLLTGLYHNNSLPSTQVGLCSFCLLISHLWGSLKCCVSPGRRADGTRAEGSSREPGGAPGGVPSPAPGPGKPLQLYGASTSAETHLLVLRCWRTSPSCGHMQETLTFCIRVKQGNGVCFIQSSAYLKLRCSPWLDVIFTGWLVVPIMYGLKQQQRKSCYSSIKQILLNSLVKQSNSQSHLPFVILAGERSINKLSDGRWIANIIDDNDQGKFPSTLSVNLIC